MITKLVRTATVWVVGGLLFAASGCAAPVGGGPDDIGTTSGALAQESVLAVGAMSAAELPETQRVALSFGGTARVYDQLQRLPVGIRACVVTRLERLGLARFIEPAAPSGQVPVLREQLRVEGGECGDFYVSLSFQQFLVGENSGEPLYSIGRTIIEWGRKAWDLLCREIKCMCAPNPTCGCLESDIADCANCPDDCREEPFEGPEPDDDTGDEDDLPDTPG